MLERILAAVRKVIQDALTEAREEGYAEAWAEQDIAIAESYESGYDAGLIDGKEEEKNWFDI